LKGIQKLLVVCLFLVCLVSLFSFVNSGYAAPTPTAPAYCDVTCTDVECLDTAVRASSDRYVCLGSSITDENGVMVMQNNITIDCLGYTIDSSAYMQTFALSANNITIKNCSMTGTTGSFISFPMSVSGINITNNTFTCDSQGQNLEAIYYNTSGRLYDHRIYDNTFSSCGYGIYMRNINESYIYDNNFTNNRYADMYFVFDNENYCANTIENNTGYGNRPILYYNNSGVNVNDTTNISQLILCNASNSNLTNISTTRIYSYYTHNMNITGVNSSSGAGYSIYLYNSNNSLIYDNYFSTYYSDDIAYIRSANDMNITKSSGTNIIGGAYIGGNYWSDYSGIDLNGDSLGDSSHELTGGAIDYYPLIIPPTCDLTCSNSDCITNNDTEGINFCLGANVPGNITFSGAGQTLHCYGYNVSGLGNTTGLTLNANTTIHYCNVFNFTYGVNVSGYNFTNISFNSIFNNTYSIFLDGISNNTTSISDGEGGWTITHYYGSYITNNTINTSTYGIFLNDSNKTKIYGNSIYNNTYGLDLKGNISEIWANDIYYNTYGVFFGNDSLTHYGNRFYDNNVTLNTYGINITSTGLCVNNSIYNNFINNTYPVYDDQSNYWNRTKTSSTNIIGGSYKGGNWWGYNIGSDTNADYLGGNYSILGGSNYDYITLYNHTDNDGDGYDTRYDCNDENSTIIPLLNSSGTNYINSDKVLCRNYYRNLKIQMNASNIILDCNSSTIYGTPPTFYIQNDSYPVHNVTIKNCNMDSQWGVAYNVYIYNSQNNTIYNNNISGTSNIGIYIQAAGFNVTGSNITRNVFTNPYYPRAETMRLSSNNPDIISYNYIYDNYFNFSNGTNEEGSGTKTNYWNITNTSGTNIMGGAYIGGNYWSNYPGGDLGSDGIGDTHIPFTDFSNITGGDYLPLTNNSISCTDSDGDGYYVDGGACGAADCNDNNASINPGVTENCTDGIDNDCDGYIDSEDGYCSCELFCTNVSCINDNSTVGVHICLNNSLSVSAESSITLAANNQTLDCQGYTISGDQQTDITSKDNAVVKNCVFTGQLTTSLSVTSCDNFTLANNNFTTVGYGLTYSTGTSLYIYGNRFNGVDIGAEITQANNTDIYNNNFVDFTEGIAGFYLIGQMSNVTIRDNDITPTHGGNAKGIYITNTNNEGYFNITNNTFYEGQYGIYLYNTNNTNITNNHLTSCSNGIRIYKSNNNSIRFNEMTTGSVGLDVPNASDNNFTSNTVFYYSTGIYDYLNSSNTYTNNSFRNSTYTFYFKNSSSTVNYNIMSFGYPEEHTNISLTGDTFILRQVRESSKPDLTSGYDDIGIWFAIREVPGIAGTVGYPTRSVNVTVYYDQEDFTNSSVESESSLKLYKKTSSGWGVSNSSIDTTNDEAHKMLSSDNSGDMHDATDTYVYYSILGTAPVQSSSSESTVGQSEFDEGEGFSTTISVVEGQESVVDVTEATLPVKQVKIKSKITKTGTINISRVAQEQAEFTVGGSDAVYEYFEVNTDISDDDIESAAFVIKVSKQWYIENNYDISETSVKRYYGGEWTDLETTLDSEDETYYYFTVNTPGFSMFVITSKVVTERALEEENISIQKEIDIEMKKDDVTLIAVLLILLLAGLYFKRDVFLKK